MFTIVKNKLDHFLFSEGHFERLGLCRFILCSILFYLACSRQLNVDQYTSLSLVPRSEALTLYPDFYKPYFQFYFWPDHYAPLIHGLYVLLIGLAALGLLNRPLMFLTWILAQGFIQRNFSLLFGADIIGTLFLFYLSFTRCHHFFTIKSFFKKKNRPTITFDSQKWTDQLSTVFLRLMQFQLMTIYTYTGLEKLKGNTWWDGTALWTILANPQFTKYDLIFLKNFPLIFAMGTFVTIIFEIYFVVLVAQKSTRYWWLSLGVLFHLMIGVLLDLTPFSLVMIATYFLFIERKYLVKLSSCLSRFEKSL